MFRAPVEESGSCRIPRKWGCIIYLQPCGGRKVDVEPVEAFRLTRGRAIIGERGFRKELR